MNMILEGADVKSAAVHTNVDRDTTTYRSRQTTQTVATGGFALDISGTVTDNSAYAGHGRTAEEVMLMAGQEDITARQNYMAVMSNSMSDEDFARLQKEGFHPGSTDIETVVTIVDHIKAALVKGGTAVTGYTDTISEETLANITGSKTFAMELQKQFEAKDIPITKENAEAVMEGLTILNKVSELSEGAVKYMVENGMEATPENLYLAQFSAATDASRQGRGYYAADHTTGYYAKKPETIDFEQLLPQMSKVIQEAGYEPNEESLDAAKWLVEKGIPLNQENFSCLIQLSKLNIPVTGEEYLQSAASAIADGKNPVKANLLQTESYAQQAAELVETTQEATDEAADLVLVKNLPLTLRNILSAQEQLNKDTQRPSTLVDGTENLRGRRILSEVRLSMTVEANLRFLRSGYQIETAPLEELVTQLKEAESSYQKVLTGETDGSSAQHKASLYQETLHILAGIRTAPSAILAQISEASTLREIATTGSRQALAYEKAGESYESLMTAPRSDLGDSIRKAFRNVDAILEDMNLELTEANQKAVRILGYNNLEITDENIAVIKEKEALLSTVVNEMKPGRVLNMIRQGENPTTMPLNELEAYLSQQTDVAQEMESYSKFLYQLEQQNSITEEERTAYIGVYRLVRQLEKNDDAALGALWQTGGELTLENLLTANRSSKRKSMDYKVDDTFGGLELKASDAKSITEQLESVFENAKQAADEFDKMVFDEVRKAVKTEEAIQQQLTDYSLPITADHLVAAKNLLHNPKEIWNKVMDSTSDTEQPEEETIFDALTQTGEQIVQSLEDKDSANEAYSDLQNLVQGVLENTAFSENATALDVKAMSNLYKQISFMATMVKEENYEIPVSIDGQLTSINLKIIHNDKQEHKATISFETAGLGKTAAEFKMTEDKLTGFCMNDAAEGTELLKENQDRFAARLSQEKIEVGSIYFVTNEKLDLMDFSMKETKGRQGNGEAGVLYKAARAFIGFTQEIAIMKGSGEYEN